MDFVHVSVRGCVGTVGVDVDGTAHPGGLAVHVLLYVEVHGAWMWTWMCYSLLFTVQCWLLGTVQLQWSILNKSKSSIIVSGEEAKSKSNNTEP